jgi:hypothetical protein
LGEELYFFIGSWDYKKVAKEDYRLGGKFVETAREQTLRDKERDRDKK